MPSVLEAWNLYRLGSIPRAREAFTAVIRDAPERADAARIGLGYCALRDGDVANAMQHFRQVLAVHPNDAEAHDGLGLAHYRAGQFDAARAELEVSLRSSPGNSELREVIRLLAPERDLKLRALIRMPSLNPSMHRMRERCASRPFRATG